MDNPTNLEIVQSLFQYYSTGNIQGFMSLLSPDVTWIEPGDPLDIPYSGTFKGMAGIGQMMGLVAHSVKMTAFSADGFCVNDSTGAVTATGSNTAQVIATGKSYTTGWVYAFKLSGGKITDVQVYMDTLAMSKAFKAA